MPQHSLYPLAERKMSMPQAPADSTHLLTPADILQPTNLTWLIQNVLRTEVTRPGFACLNLPSTTTSFQLRQCMVSLKEALSDHFETTLGQRLEYYSMGRFDQKKTTRLHLDGGPTCSFLMLGYEPSSVVSQFQIADFSRCAHDRGLSPREFLETSNPMFIAEGRAALEPYTYEIPDWDDGTARIVVINNSSQENGTSFPGLGVLHGAQILSAEEGMPRIINSTMFVPMSELPAPVDRSTLETFLKTEAISGTIL